MTTQPPSSLDRASFRRVRPGEPDWPTRLDTMERGPRHLWARGPIPPASALAVAIVGQRRATSYGREIAAWLADEVARVGVVVVSGGAVGIDAAAHRAAADAGGRTAVVLGCGPQRAYPSQHARAGGLFDHVVDRGGVLLSQWEGRDEPLASRVLARNRLVAGLADAVVVVEGGARSGSLNTASHAADLGVPVLAVPGDVRAPGSGAPHRLLADGCAPCCDAQDILAAIGARLDLLGTPTSAPGPGAAGGGGPSVLPAAVFDVLAATFPRPVPVDDLACRSAMAAGQLLAVLTRARIAGEVTTETGGVRLRHAAR